MLGGSIDVKSEVGLGTEVKIQIPLLRVTGTDTPISTPNTQSSLERTQDDSIGVLQSEAPGMTVAFYGFETTSAPSTEVALAEMDKVLKQYITKWYGLKVLKAWQPSKKVDFIIVDEKNLPDLVLRSTAPNCSIIALSTNASRHVQSSLLDIHPGIELLFKPFGPFKLAKALRSALERKRALAAGFSPVFSPSTDMSGRKSSGTPNEPPVLEFEAVTLASESPNAPINVQTTTEGNITAGDTENALMAVENASIGGSTSTEKASTAGFPFPDQSSDASGENRASSRPSGFLVRKSSSRPALTHRKTEPADYGKSTWDSFGSPIASKPGSPTHKRKTSFAAQPVRSPGPQPAPQTPGKRPPRILLVDDNKINLRLLKTFMMKREYQLVDSADNGHSAVQAAESQKDGYDVIFMGMSSPDSCSRVHPPLRFR
jgi:CheY-like chemotaxis protein